MFYAAFWDVIGPDLLPVYGDEKTRSAHLFNEDGAHYCLAQEGRAGTPGQLLANSAPDPRLQDPS